MLKKNVFETRNIELRHEKSNSKNLAIKNSLILVTTTINSANRVGATRTTARNWIGYCLFDKKL